MFYLIYVSSATRNLSSEELLEILRVSRRNNVENEITGMLLYKEGNFMQVLEGPKETVQQLHDKIELDARHKQMITLLSGQIEERQFPNWSMGFQNVDELNEDDRAAYSPFLNEPSWPEAFANSPSKAYTLLLSFKKSMR